jgi:RNA polymerase sigma-32 factor
MSYALALANPGSDIDKYLNQVYSIPILTREQEFELTREFYNTEDVKVAHKLVISHLRFVVHIAKSYAGYGLPIADIIQEGNLGLLKAVKKFDPDKGVRLVSFAVHWIKAEIHEFILKNWRIVKIATTKAQRKLFFNLRSKKKSTGWLSDKEAKKIAADLDVSYKEVMHMENRLNSSDSPFDMPVGDEDDEKAFSPSQYIEDNSFNPEDLAVKDNYENVNYTALMKNISGLDRRAQDIVKARWLDDQKLTLNELADKYSVSAERIRQIEAAAFKKLKTSLVNV